jgi:hypothetical protein
MALIVSINVQFRLYGPMTNSLAARAPFDGWAEDTTDPNSYKDYYYPNGQNARTLWLVYSPLDPKLTCSNY